MRNQSKTEPLIEFAPIRLDPAFPVSEPDISLRGEETPIPPHTHDCFEIGYCEEGMGFFFVEDKVLSFKAGDASVINRRELHLMCGDSQSKAKWGFLNLDPVGLLASYAPAEEHFLETESLSGPQFNNIISGEEDTGMSTLIRDIIHLVGERPEGYRSETRALVWALMVRLHRHSPPSKDQSVDRGLKREKLARIGPALGCIAEHYDSELSVPRLAALCQSSESNFRKLFHAAMGRSPREHIRHVRMKAAINLLEHSQRSILDIALSCGYPTLSNFIRVFGEDHDLSPRRWRQRHAAGIL